MESEPLPQPFPEPFKSHVERFAQNVARVGSLVDLHEFLEPLTQFAPDDHTRPSPDDVLRAAVVLLHACLEDFLRSMLMQHYPRDGKSLEKLPLAGANRRERFSMADLSVHRGKSVDEVIKESIDESLHQRSFNHCDDLSNAIETLGMKTSDCNKQFPMLEKMMQRRHEIVHYADRPRDYRGADWREVQAITRAEVLRWKIAVNDFFRAVIVALYWKLESEA